EVVRREARGGGSGLDIDALADAIMGADKPAPVTRHAHELGEGVLRVTNLVLGSSLDISDLEVRAGEVVGIAGVEGNGQRELVRILAGLVPEARGTVDLVGGPPAVVH